MIQQMFQQNSKEIYFHSFHLIGRIKPFSLLCFTVSPWVQWGFLVIPEMICKDLLSWSFALITGHILQGEWSWVWFPTEQIKNNPKHLNTSRATEWGSISVFNSSIALYIRTFLPHYWGWIRWRKVRSPRYSPTCNLWDSMLFVHHKMVLLKI